MSGAVRARVRRVCFYTYTYIYAHAIDNHQRQKHVPCHHTLQLASMLTRDGTGCVRCWRCLVDPVGPKIYEMRLAILHDTFPLRFCPAGIANPTPDVGVRLSRSQARQVWERPDFIEYALRELISTYNTTVSFRTMASSHSRLAWDCLFLLGHCLIEGGSRAGGEFVFGKALDISEAEQAVDRGGEDHLATHYMGNHHLLLGEGSLRGDHPDVDQAERALQLGGL